jgi:hypothetical protein
MAARELQGLRLLAAGSVEGLLKIGLRFLFALAFLRQQEQLSCKPVHLRFPVDIFVSVGHDQRLCQQG